MVVVAANQLRSASRMSTASHFSLNGAGVPRQLDTSVGIGAEGRGGLSVAGSPISHLISGHYNFPEPHLGGVPVQVRHELIVRSGLLPQTRVLPTPDGILHITPKPNGRAPSQTPCPPTSVHARRSAECPQPAATGMAPPSTPCCPIPGPAETGTNPPSCPWPRREPAKTPDVSAVCRAALWCIAAHAAAPSTAAGGNRGRVESHRRQYHTCLPPMRSHSHIAGPFRTHRFTLADPCTAQHPDIHNHSQ